jgi:predicted RNA-binding Zn-ribbon protein involved in translation (DUF1610 family)
VSTADVDPVFLQIDSWFARAPEGLSENETVGWVQSNADVVCPECGDVLWIMRARRAQDRGYYHLAMCQNPECAFQKDD